MVWSNAGLGKGLWPLTGITSVYGALVVVGAPDGTSVLETLQGLDNVQVRTSAAVCVWGGGALLHVCSCE